MDVPKGVSIIICCHNSDKRIPTTLRYLQGQRFSETIRWEVIVVDNASTDQTTEVAKQQWALNPVTSFTVVTEQKPGLMHARYCGLAHARYSIVSFIDDDNWTEDKWVEKIYLLLSADNRIGACGGKVLPVFEEAPPEWFFDFQSSFAVGQQMPHSGVVGKNGVLWGAGLSFRLSIWKELQQRQFKNITIGREGNSLSAGEDSELCYAIRLLGYNLYYEDNLLLQHYMPPVRMMWSYLERMNVGFGRANVRLNCYRTLLPGGPVMKHWTRELMYAVKLYYFNNISAVFIKEKKVKWQKRILASYYKGMMLQLWADRNKLKEMISYLKSTFPFVRFAHSEAHCFPEVK